MLASRKRIYAMLLVLAGGSMVAAAAADPLQPQSAARPQARTAVLYGTESVLGRPVLASGEHAGWIVDVIADKTGQVRAAIVDYGGFLGIGSRRIAVAWSDLQFGPDSNPKAVAVDLPRERLARAPTVRTGEPVTVIGLYRPWHRAARN
jgi:hypothetical protein